VIAHPHPTVDAAGRTGERGAAMVEFAFVLVPLCLLVFGIISFGVILSFRQTMTQAAAEGARAAAAAPRDLAVARAQAATQQAMGAYDRQCNAGTGVTCTFAIADCDGTTDGNDPAVADCMTVEIRYDQAGHPLLPQVPLLSLALPHEVVTRSVVQVDDEGP